MESDKYIEGFLAGQTVAYCEQVRLGSRLAGSINCNERYIDKLILIAEQEECKIEIIPTECDRVCLYIYRYDFIKTIIDYMKSNPEKEFATDFDIWVAGKLFGYADCEIADCITRSKAK
jgi:hypothetical protein